MGIYQRYFRVTEGPLVEKAREIRASNVESRKAVLAFCNEIGAENAMGRKDGQLTGFKFSSTPDQQAWKSQDKFGAYWPRKNTAAGREILKRIEDLPKVQHIEVALSEIGLSADCPVLIEARAGYCATLCGSPEGGVLFVGVPWRDVSADELAEYRSQKDAGTRFSVEMEHLCWMPSEHMKEVKRWQVEQEIDELNDRLREKEQQKGGAA